MTRFSYHVSQEQFAPQALLQLVRRAEQAGFDAAFSSDHLQPWSPTQGQSAFTWSWLGAALQATEHMTFGTVTVPGGWRYHPVVLAQAIATLASMFPGRLPWVALGSGEALNEAMVAPSWPRKSERNRRLQHAAQAMRALFDGQRVTTPGPPAMHDARLWCRPAAAPQLFGAALSPVTAQWLGSWADGLLTISRRIEDLRSNIAAFRRGGGIGKPVCIKVDLCWGQSEDEALREAHARWRFNAAGGEANGERRQPEDFDLAAHGLTPEDMRRHVFVAADLDAHIEHLRRCIALGADVIDLHHVGADQEGFIDLFGAQVLPVLRAEAAAAGLSGGQ